MRREDARKVLGVTHQNATPADIRKAYLRLALKTHPDKGGTVDAFRAAQEAYETLRPKKAGALAITTPPNNTGDGTTEPPSGKPTPPPPPPRHESRYERRAAPSAQPSPRRHKPDSFRKSDGIYDDAARQSRRQSTPEGAAEARNDRVAKAKARDQARETAAAVSRAKHRAASDDYAAAIEDSELEEALRISIVQQRGKAAAAAASVYSSRAIKEDEMIALALARSHDDARQVLLLGDFGFSRVAAFLLLNTMPAVAAAYADSRIALDAVLDRMFEDCVDFSDEPVWVGRERNVQKMNTLQRVATQAATAFTSVAGTVRGRMATGLRKLASMPSMMLSQKSTVQRRGALFSSSASSPWVKYVDPESRSPYWYNELLELSAWSDPTLDSSTQLFDSRY
ncbi:hypothetical protein CTAYLR_008363 [Chrysophaeum taylorii]|uniref:J domain-containing protein n=1 Tax=Chrysophaeum taylorii TaxID=2483200 RepID=A0AAD7XMP3_9STRA|nr:hypothetical protein CTAYLR_008363 [Chrysophaeum taylorii]